MKNETIWRDAAGRLNVLQWCNP